MVRHLHRKIVQTLSTHTPAMTLFYCSVILLILGWFDVITGDYSLIIFYLIPVSIAAWFVSKKSGLLFCLLAIVVRLVADEGSRPPLPSHSVLNYWNEVMEFIFLLITSLLLSALKNNLENEKDPAKRDPLK
jgi:uncharacterized RDD family membrane protein YckC